MTTLLFFANLNDAYKRNRPFIDVKPTKIIINILNYLLSAGLIVDWGEIKANAESSKRSVQGRPSPKQIVKLRVFLSDKPIGPANPQPMVGVTPSPPKGGGNQILSQKTGL